MPLNDAQLNTQTFDGPTSAGVPRGRTGNTPSRNAQTNTVDTFQLVRGQDSNGSQPGSYQPYQVEVTCQVQQGNLARELNGASVRQFIPYLIYFDANPGLAIGDMVKWDDDLGVTRKILVTGVANQVGQGGSFELEGEERL